MTAQTRSSTRLADTPHAAMRSRAVLCTQVALCLLISGTGASLAQAQSASPDTVHLRFGWQPGMHARIETTRLSVQVAATADSVSGSAEYRMRVGPHAAGVIISYDGFVFPPAADSSEAAQLNSLAERAAAMVPKVVVDSAGAFVRVEDVDVVRARLDSLMTQMLDPEEAAAARETLETMVTAEALAGLAAQEWNAIVGRWAGADLVIGTKYGFEEQAALPMIPGAAVTMVSEFSIERRTSCAEAGTDQDCVEIRLVSRADSAAVRKLLAEFTERLLAMPGLGIAFESFEMETEMVLVTEPSTLRPHRVRMSKHTKGVVSAQGERGEVSQSEVRTYGYTWVE